MLNKERQGGIANAMLAAADDDYKTIYPKGTILNYILSNAPKEVVQQAVQSFNLSSIGYYLKRSIINDYPKYRNRNGDFGVELANDLRPYSADWSFLQNANRDIDKCRRLMKLFGRHHPRYNELALMHDSLVLANNKMCEPITEFLKLYQKRQKDLGKSFRIVKHKESVKLPKLKL